MFLWLPGREVATPDTRYTVTAEKQDLGGGRGGQLFSCGEEP